MSKHYSIHAVDCVYSRDTAEAALSIAISASHRTGESVSIFRPGESQQWLVVSSHAQRGKATVTLKSS